MCARMGAPRTPTGACEPCESCSQQRSFARKPPLLSFCSQERGAVVFARERATPAPAAESVTETAPRSMQSPRPAPLGAAPRPGLLAGKELSLFPPVRHASQAEASPWPERRTPLAFFDPRSPSSRLPLTGNPYDHATDDLRPALDDNRCARVWVRMQIGVQPKCPKTQEPVPSQPRRSGSNQRRFQPTSPPHGEAVPTHTSPHRTERRFQPTPAHTARRGGSNPRTPHGDGSNPPAHHAERRLQPTSPHHTERPFQRTHTPTGTAAWRRWRSGRGWRAPAAAAQACRRSSTRPCAPPWSPWRRRRRRRRQRLCSPPGPPGPPGPPSAPRARHRSRSGPPPRRRSAARGDCRRSSSPRLTPS